MSVLVKLVGLRSAVRDEDIATAVGVVPALSSWRRSGDGRGDVFVRLHTPAEADEVVAAFDGKVMCGSVVSVQRCDDAAMEAAAANGSRVLKLDIRRHGSRPAAPLRSAAVRNLFHPGAAIDAASVVGATDGVVGVTDASTDAAGDDVAFVPFVDAAAAAAVLRVMPSAVEMELEARRVTLLPSLADFNDAAAVLCYASAGVGDIPIGAAAVVRLSNLPFTATPDSIAAPFSGLSLLPNGVYVDPSWPPTGEAYLVFANEEHAVAVLFGPRFSTDGRPVWAHRSSLDELRRCTLRPLELRRDKSGIIARAPDAVIHFRNAYCVKEFELRAMFKDNAPEEILRVVFTPHWSGRVSGEGFVEFVSLEAAHRGLARNKSLVGGRQLCLCLASVDDIVERLPPPGPPVMRASSSSTQSSVC